MPFEITLQSTVFGLKIRARTFGLANEMKSRWDLGMKYSIKLF